MLRIAICDDDTHFTGNIEALVVQNATRLGIQVEIDVFFDGLTLMSNIFNGKRYELIFLDIEMEKVNGIDTAHKIRILDKTVLLVYISGYDQYLKELFEVEPFRFLSKPLDMEQFNRYFQEACQRIKETESYYQFTFNKEIRKIVLKNIIYFESQNRVIHIFLEDGTKEQFYGKLNNVEKELMESRYRFLRIHQSFLVNYDYIKGMNFSNITLDIGGGKVINLKISEDRQRSIRTQLCEIAAGKAVIE